MLMYSYIIASKHNSYIGLIVTPINYYGSNASPCKMQCMQIIHDDGSGRHKAAPLLAYSARQLLWRETVMAGKLEARFLCVESRRQRFPCSRSGPLCCVYGWMVAVTPCHVHVN